jgi:hypothetical protein
MNQRDETNTGTSAIRATAPAPFTNLVPVPEKTTAVTPPGAAKGDDDVMNQPVKPS